MPAWNREHFRLDFPVVGGIGPIDAVQFTEISTVQGVWLEHIGRPVPVRESLGRPERLKIKRSGLSVFLGDLLPGCPAVPHEYR